MMSRSDSPTEASPPSDYDGPKLKRSRVALACLRCRSRKQKCNGAQSQCSTCQRLGLECRYKAHLTPKPEQKRIYIKALEEHVADLERLLAESGHNSVTVDHWKERRHQLRRDSYMQTEACHQNPQDSLSATTKDPIWDAIISSRDDQSTLSAGRLFKSVIHSDASRTTYSDRLPATSQPIELAPPEIASKLLNGYIKHLSTQYPVLHTPRLKELHTKPFATLSIFEQCILHLVYANSGRILEAVCGLSCTKRLCKLIYLAWRVWRGSTCRGALSSRNAAYRCCSGTTRSAIRAVTAPTGIVLLERLEESWRMDTCRTCSAAVHRARFTSEIGCRRSDNGKGIESTNILVMLLS